MDGGRVAVKQERSPEQVFPPAAGRKQIDGGCPGFKAERCDPVGVSSEGGDVFPDPFQRRDLIQQPEV